ncbi:MAG TPA: hypothetical protein VEW03_02970, partial [Longimicrobiaceae bacterium]|nr:hypothetical protein [Longimicrobiaceae bacterium]
LVWGWWGVLLLRGTRRPLVSALAMLLASAAAGFVVWQFAARPGTLAFAGAAAAAGWAHLAWRQHLHSSTSPGP